MSGSDVRKPFEEQHQRIMELAESIIENATDSSRDDIMEMLREVVSENELNMNSQIARWNAYEAVKKIMDQSVNCVIHVQEIFDEEVKNIPSDIKTVFVKSFDDLSMRRLEEKLDLSLQMNNSAILSQPVLDPWTKLPIKNPVRSTICAHTYDKDSITCQIKTNKKFRCPYIGCNAVLTKKNITNV